MTVVAERAFSSPTGPRALWTVSDLARLPRTLANGDVRYELNDGELITMAPPGYDHAFRQAQIIQAFASAARHGQSLGEVAIILRRNPDRVVAPDAALILNASLPVQRSREGYLETIPEIVVEVRSKNDSKIEVATKIDEYVAAGVKEIWVVDSESSTLFVHSADGSVAVFRDNDDVVSPLLPGITVNARLILASC